jgi:hypothetical protein
MPRLEVTAMRTRVLAVLLLSGVALTTGACATSEEWAEWRKHPTHFASGEHLFFSLRNREGAPPRVTRSDLELARTQAWWGRTITVTPEQIFRE